MKNNRHILKQKTRIWKSVIFLIVLLIASRFIGLPGNFTPLLALAVFMPRLTNNKHMPYLFPVSIISFTNLFLEPVGLTILITILMVFAITPFISQSSKSLPLGCLSTVLIWHFSVNGAVWLSSGGSLIQTYITAIPFDFKLAISTGLYVALFHYAENLLMILSGSNKKFFDRVKALKA